MNVIGQGEDSSVVIPRLCSAFDEERGRASREVTGIGLKLEGVGSDDSEKINHILCRNYIQQ